MWLIWYRRFKTSERDCYILWTNPLNLSQCQLSVVFHIPCHLTVYFFLSIEICYVWIFPSIFCNTESM